MSRRGSYHILGMRQTSHLNQGTSDSNNILPPFLHDEHTSREGMSLSLGGQRMLRASWLCHWMFVANRLQLPLPPMPRIHKVSSYLDPVSNQNENRIRNLEFQVENVWPASSDHFFTGYVPNRWCMLGGGGALFTFL